MLKGIAACISPALLQVLSEMGGAAAPIRAAGLSAR